ncbi:MAG: NYN domain-containing protein [Thermodesulfobacteriota bacterium]
MAFHIIIDGYNLIRNYPPLAKEEYRDFSRGREALLQWLAAYRKMAPHPFTVVFDGHKGGALAEERDVYKGIKILYSRSGQTADDLIKGLVSREGERFLVVTSDLELGNYCRSCRAGVIPSQSFTARVEEKERLKNRQGFGDEEEIPTPLKKKKGKAFRMSKKVKKEKKLWEKL